MRNDINRSKILSKIMEKILNRYKDLNVFKKMMNSIILDSYILQYKYHVNNINVIDKNILMELKLLHTIGNEINNRKVGVTVTGRNIMEIYFNEKHLYKIIIDFNNTSNKFKAAAKDKYNLNNVIYTELDFIAHPDLVNKFKEILINVVNNI